GRARHCGGPRIRILEDGGAEYLAVRSAGGAARARPSRGGRPVAQAVPRRRHRPAGARARPRHRRGMRAGLGARRPHLPGARCRRRTRGPHLRLRSGRSVVPLGQLPFPSPGWRDLLEILIVAYVLYALLRFLVGTRALQIVFGLLVLAVIYLVAFLLKLS